jgi:hypothetical protein
MSDISTELRSENCRLNDQALHTAEKAMGRAQAAIEAVHPDLTDDEDPRTDQRISVEPSLRKASVPLALGKQLLGQCVLGRRRLR